MGRHTGEKLTVSDLSPVVYSAGRVFNDLSTSLLDTETFLRLGRMEGAQSRSDLALLEDLRDVAQFIIDHGQARRSIDAEFVRAVNATIKRSGALRPGEFRRDDQGIGVGTRYGEHMPPASDESELQRLIADALEAKSLREKALNLFVTIAKAQPFEDGNKRTAIFVANGLLILEQAHELLTVPLDEPEAYNARQTGSFHDALARSYIYSEDHQLKDLLRARGFRALP